MKKIILAFFCILSIYNVNAQDDKLNTVKFNFFGLGVNTLSFQYERTLNEHSSALMHVGFTLPRSLPNSLFEIDTFATNGSYNQLLSAKFTGGIHLTPEYRYYFKGEGNTGFYLGGYLRYSRYGLNSALIHREDAFSPIKTYDFTVYIGCQF